MLHPLEHVRDHQSPLADTPALASCQAPQLGRPRFAAKKVCRHTPSPKHGTFAHQLYHIWGSPEVGITPPAPALRTIAPHVGCLRQQQKVVSTIDSRSTVAAPAASLQRALSF